MTSQVEPQVELTNAPQPEEQMEAPVDSASKPLTVKEIVALLSTQFPLCFSLAGAAKPLKIGIFQDLIVRLADNPLLSKTQLRQALRVYTSSWRYLEAVKEGVARVDLEGQPGDLIDLQQAEHAAKSLEDSKARAAEIRKAKAAEHRAKVQQQKQAEAAKASAAPARTEKPAYKKITAKPAVKQDKTAQMGDKRAQEREHHKKDVQPKTAAPTPLLTPVVLADLLVGMKVLVKLGQNPMPATVVEVVKQDVVVQLASGMVVKTHYGSLYQA